MFALRISRGMDRAVVGLQKGWGNHRAAARTDDQS